MKNRRKYRNDDLNGWTAQLPCVLWFMPRPCIGRSKAIFSLISIILPPPREIHFETGLGWTLLRFNDIFFYKICIIRFSMKARVFLDFVHLWKVYTINSAFQTQMNHWIWQKPVLRHFHSSFSSTRPQFHFPYKLQISDVINVKLDDVKSE